MKKKIMILVGIVALIVVGNYFANSSKNSQQGNDIDLHSHGDGGLHSH